MHCALHTGSTSHTTDDCNLLKRNPHLYDLLALKSSSTTTNDHDHVSWPTKPGMPKVDRWCISTVLQHHATYDSKRCRNVRKCHVVCPFNNVVCKEMGDTTIEAVDPISGRKRHINLANVLIHESFPCHMFSEAIVLASTKGCTSTKKLGHWELHNSTGKMIIRAPQLRLNIAATNPAAWRYPPSGYYFINEQTLPFCAPHQGCHKGRGEERGRSPRRDHFAGRL
jgi:hypothetical protein